MTVKVLEKNKNGLIMVHRKIVETGLNRHGQHILINSTTIHKVDEVIEDGWGILAHFDDAVKLTPKGKSLKVCAFFVCHLKFLMFNIYR